MKPGALFSRTVLAVQRSDSRETPSSPSWGNMACTTGIAGSSIRRRHSRAVALVLGGCMPDAAARAQNVVGADEFVRGRASVHAGVAQHQILHHHEAAFEAQRVGGVDEVGASEKSLAQRALVQPLVKPRHRVLGARQRRGEGGPVEIGIRQGGAAHGAP